MTITRRHAVKVILGSGLAIYLTPRSISQAFASQRDQLKHISPIDRTLPDTAAANFFADNPERVHSILWDKVSYFTANKLTVAKPTKRVPLVIVGGGMSGLSTAYLLRDKKPIVLEQDPRFGGNSKGQSWRGIDYSIGAAYFIEPDPDSNIAQFVGELGFGSTLKLKSEEGPVAIGQSIYQNFWEGSSLEKDPEGLRQIRLLGDYFRKVNDGEEIPFPDIPITDESLRGHIAKLDGLSFKQHLEEIVGAPLHAHIDTAIQHYCWSSLGASSTEISAAAGLNFYAAEFGTLALLPGGNSAVAERLLQKLSEQVPPENLRASSLVVDVDVSKDGVQVNYLDAAGTVQSVFADVAVMACPKFIAAKLINGMEPERQAAISRLKYRSYLVANVCLSQTSPQNLYDLYLLGAGKLKSAEAQSASSQQKVTDVIIADFAAPNAQNTVLTLYRPLPYDGARAELYLPDSYQRFRSEFETQIRSEILPLLRLDQGKVQDLRIARWGHPLVVPSVGLMTSGVVETLRKPFREKVFFVEQDNWMLPAFETAVTEALLHEPLIRAQLTRRER